MTTALLIRRSLRHYRAAHLATALATAVCAMVITGALLVGDSVRHSLRQRVALRLGRTTHAVTSGDRLTQADLARRLTVKLGVPLTAVLQVPGMASAPDRNQRLNRIVLLGIEDSFSQLTANGLFPVPGPGEAVLGADSAARLHLAPGDVLVVRTEKLTAFPRETPLAAAADGQAVLRLTLKAVIGPAQMADFSLRAENLPPHNVFVNRSDLCRALKLPDRANLFLMAGDRALTRERVAAALATQWTLADLGLTLNELPGETTELTSERIFLDPAVSHAAARLPGAATFLTYFANTLRCADRVTPYSFVTGTDAAWLPTDLGNDGIALNQWLADDLPCRVGDELTLSYFSVGALRLLEERQATFKVRHIVPLERPFADPSLMPAIPGLAEAEHCAEWEPGIPIDLKRVRDQDEEYWKRWRGAPKAFVSLATAQRLWANRFGDATAVRTALPVAGVQARLRESLPTEALGLQVQPVLEEGLQAAGQAVDFAQLFLGLSGFLIVAALLLTGLLFGLSLDYRRGQVGTLLALGFTPRQVQRLVLAEGFCVALPGVLVGAALGLLYNHAAVLALSHVWQASVGSLPVAPALTVRSLVVGAAASLGAATLVLGWMARRLTATTVGTLHGGAVSPTPNRRRLLRLALLGLGLVSSGAALAMAGDPRHETTSAGLFFAAGTLLLLGGLAGWMAVLQGLLHVGFGGLSVRNAARRPGRSLAVCGTLACAVFLVVAVGANRRRPPVGSGPRDSGTGGFSFYGETSLPLLADANTPNGRRALGLDETTFPAGLKLVNLTLSEGDNASCLNLNRTGRPRLLGVDPAEFSQRGAFTAVTTLDGTADGSPWERLNQDLGPDTIPAIADQSVIVWGLGLRVGATLTLPDSRGRPVRLRFVAGLANSVFQGHVLISATRFRELFPDAGGARVLLVEAPTGQEERAAAWLQATLADRGLELSSCRDRLAAFGAVENTYLAIFLALGGLGLVLGGVALGALVTRHALERRGELALLRAVGFRRAALVCQVTTEHALLLFAGLTCGALAGWVAVYPSVAGKDSHPDLIGVALWCALILLSGMLWIVGAALRTTRGTPADSLRDE
jgi:ABC-type lipoprotein release transport system permease subunit